MSENNYMDLREKITGTRKRRLPREKIKILFTEYETKQ